MNTHTRIIIAIVLVLLIPLALWQTASGQTGRWTLPYRLSSGKGKADEATLVADRYGSVHAFWTEDLPDNRTIIQYARFDGESWTFPIDIYISLPFIGIGTVSAAVDHDGTLAIVWTEGISGPAYYSSAPAYGPVTAAVWAKPTRILVPADGAVLRIDSQGIFHVLYTKFLGDNPGVYYIRSENKGITWSVPVWLDPDITENHGPRSLHFEIDGEDGLHAAWYYVPRDAVGGNWVRYVHSLDGGETWSTPFTIDIAADDNSGLQNAGPVMTVQGTTAHIIWAGGELNFRNHRYSRDAGRTWSPTARIMGDLNGQAFDGLAIDGAGRIHYFAQLRFPQGIYHTYWDRDHWSSPSLIYLIRTTGEEPIIDQVHAHHTHAAVRAGNQLVVTFNDPPPEPTRRLFAMSLVLDDIPAIPLEPTPTVEVTPEASPTVQPSPTPTARDLNFEQDATITEMPSPIASMWIGFIPTFAFLLGVIVYMAYVKGRR